MNEIILAEGQLFTYKDYLTNELRIYTKTRNTEDKDIIKELFRYNRRNIILKLEVKDE